MNENGENGCVHGSNEVSKGGKCKRKTTLDQI